jgi:hypothetical protein
MWTGQGNEPKISQAPMNQQYEEYKATVLLTMLFYGTVCMILQ